MRAFQKVSFGAAALFAVSSYVLAPSEAAPPVSTDRQGRLGRRRHETSPAERDSEDASTRDSEHAHGRDSESNGRAIRRRGGDGERHSSSRASEGHKKFIKDLEKKELELPLEFDRLEQGVGASSTGSRGFRQRLIARRSESENHLWKVKVVDRLGECEKGMPACLYEASIIDDRRNTGTSTNIPKKVLIKHFNLSSPENQALFDKEVASLDAFGSSKDYIITYLGSTVEGENGYVVMEHAVTNLAEIMDDSEVSISEDTEDEDAGATQDKIVLEADDMVSLLTTGIGALDVLHNCNEVFHSEITPENILFVKNRTETAETPLSLRLSDFMLSGDYMNGSVTHFSPERLVYSYLWTQLGQTEWEPDVADYFGDADPQTDLQAAREFGGIDDVYALGLSFLQAACLKDEVIEGKLDTASRFQNHAGAGQSRADQGRTDTDRSSRGRTDTERGGRGRTDGDRRGRGQSQLEKSVVSFMDDLKTLMRYNPQDFPKYMDVQTESGQSKVQLATQGGLLVVKMLLENNPDVDPADELRMEDLPETCSMELLDLIAPMLHPLPHVRPTSKDLAQVLGITSTCESHGSQSQAPGATNNARGGSTTSRRRPYTRGGGDESAAAPPPPTLRDHAGRAPQRRGHTAERIARRAPSDGRS